MTSTARFPDSLVRELERAKILGVRSGRTHRYTAVWVVVVDGRVFVRSWSDSANGWFRAFAEEPDGSMQVGKREVRVTGKVPRSQKIRASVSRAYGEKYDTRASQKWVDGFAEPEREANTLELMPRTSTKKMTAKKGAATKAPATTKAAPTTIDDYIAAQPPKVRPILKKIRSTIRAAAPDAEETISYQIPTFKQNGALAHFAAFKNHIGFYPPVKGDAKLEAAVRRYAGEKGNLRFPLDEPIPYDLITKIVKMRMRQNAKKK